MVSKTITITNSEGLHARSATYFIQRANTYKCSLWIQSGNKKANGKSLLGVLSMGIGKDDVITLTADGEDEVQAIEGLTALILGGFAG
ncbi:MAG: HPr family phosphocarrier protein [Ruminococcaceae bacterium]|nr:HPr family phosphocarrier protein [Oscillospiraceae bacterium]